MSIDELAPDNPIAKGSWASSVAEWFFRNRRGGDDRALTSSEVLFLELLQISRRREWHSFAVGLLVERAHQHVQVICTTLEAARRAERPSVGALGTEQLEASSPVADLSRLHLRAQQKHAELVRFSAFWNPMEGGNEAVHTQARSLLSSFATAISHLPDATRERIDRAIEIRHRRFVVLGHPENQGGSGLDAEMKTLRDEVSESLHPHALAGLSLSGGGIRSASFAIGALQAMSRAAVLPAFDYISSVSGGGYAASWLAAWAYRHGGGIHGADRELFRSLDADSGPLRWVRRHSSYLAPRPGLSSSDGWALLVAYISNWLPILGLIALAMLSLLLFPHFLSSSADALVRTNHNWLKVLSVAGSLGILILYMGLVRRLTLFYRLPGTVEREPKGLPQLVFWGALVVTLTLSVSMPLLSEMVRIYGWRAVGAWPFGQDSILEPHATIFLFWLAASLVSCLIAKALSTESGQRFADGFRTGVLPLEESGQLRWNGTPIWLLVVSLGASSLIATMMLAELLPLARSNIDRPWIAVALGPMVLMSVFAISELCGLLLTLNYQRDVDRAWAARVGAWMLACVAGWTIVCGFSLGVSALWYERVLRELNGAVLCISAVALFVCAMVITWRLAGRRGLMYLGVSGALLIPLMFGGLTNLTKPSVTGQVEVQRVAIALAVTATLTLLLAAFTNVNRYSLHAIYKEGLVRTFLGASRLGPRNPHVRPPLGVQSREEPQFKERRPDPITNIDDDDNPSLTWMRSAPGRELPILLLNAAVNGRSPTDHEGRVPRQWPFTFSQYFSGSPANGIGYATTSAFSSADGGFGVTLGAAMAVSGAAMSPTSGRKTHPVTAFVLGILNARLGIWIGNPRFPDAVVSAKPRLAGFTVLREMLGFRAKFDEWIHLSDGGHFENLGVYELLRRGCRRIVVIDASCDPGRTFSDLANAIRRARIDLGIQVHRHGSWEIFGPDGSPRKESQPKVEMSDCGPVDQPGAGRARSWSWFEINYGQDLPRGRLLYVKPSVYEDQDLPVEVRNYWRESPGFPHESTADQFFAERQMEAYRSLGELCMIDAMTAVLKDTRGMRSTVTQDADPHLLQLVRRSLLKPGTLSDTQTT